MTIKMFTDYMRDQIESIIKYRQELSIKENREVNIEDAAMHWYQTGKAEEYSTKYLKEHRITCEEADLKGVIDEGPRCLDLGIEMKLISCKGEGHKEVLVDRLDVRYCVRPNGCEFVNYVPCEGISYCTKPNGEKK